jgi:predicted AAA+ superfamily ATPase
VRFENAVAAMLLKQVHFRQDALGKAAGLHYIRTKDGAEVDFALSEDNQLTHLIECKLADPTLARALVNFAGKFPQAEAIQLVRDLRQEEYRAPVQISDAAHWLRRLDA